MAATFTAGASTVFGNQRVVTGVLTFDAVTGVVSFGLGTLTSVQWSPKSLTTGAVPPRVRLNALAAATASVGDVGVSGVATGDEIYITVYGR